MDFELSDDQLALQEGVEAFCQARFTSEQLHELADNGGTPDGEAPGASMSRELWQELAELGVFGLGLPEEDGGAGLGWVEAAVVFEQLGRFLVPGPLVATYLWAMRGQSPAAVTGEKIASLMVADEAPYYIEHPSLADVILAQRGDEVSLLSEADSKQLLTQAEACSPLDPLTPAAKLDVGQSIDPLAGDPLPDDPLAGDPLPNVWQQGAVLTSAQQLGLAVGATDQAVAYAKEREQFNKPIGQFQAVKHLCADMLTAVEVARAGVYYAAALLDNPDIADADRAASVARITASQAAELCGRHCVQIHGGMGYTWEMDAHLFLKRAWVLETTFGTPHTHAETLATMC